MSNQIKPPAGRKRHNEQSSQASFASAQRMQAALKHLLQIFYTSDCSLCLGRQIEYLLADQSVCNMGSDESSRSCDQHILWHILGSHCAFSALSSTAPSLLQCVPLKKAAWHFFKPRDRSATQSNSTAPFYMSSKDVFKEMTEEGSKTPKALAPAFWQTLENREKVNSSRASSLGTPLQKLPPRWQLTVSRRWLLWLAPRRCRSI
jgi:hypothetical protein